LQRVEQPLISVVIPAFNAQTTILPTIQSVCLQTLRELEILVVDDGSGDDTAKIVEAAAKEDSRIRLIKQANKGVAAARNTGIGQARAPFVAPVDADDLWRPEKLALQYHAIEDLRISMVYTGYCTIDEEGKVVSAHRPHHKGRVLEALFSANIVGNGSSALMRTADVRRIGGYDSGLRAQNAQGCEDLSLYMRLADLGEFALVPEYVTGYRELADNMSSNFFHMLKSFDLVQRPYIQRNPEHRDLFLRGRADFIDHMFRRSVRDGKWRSALDLLKAAHHQDRGLLFRLLGSRPLVAAVTPKLIRLAVRKLRRTKHDLVGRDFLDLPPGV